MWFGYAVVETHQPGDEGDEGDEGGNNYLALAQRPATALQHSELTS
jgi:hypothetical protein